MDTLGRAVCTADHTRLCPTAKAHPFMSRWWVIPCSVLRRSRFHHDEGRLAKLMHNGRPMDDERARTAIAYLVVDDYYGLWEVLHAVEGEFPQAPQPEVHALARRVLREMIREGSVEVFRGLSFSGEEIRVPDDEVDTELAEESWEMGGALEHIRVTSSDAAFREFTHTDN